MKDNVFDLDLDKVEKCFNGAEGGTARVVLKLAARIRELEAETQRLSDQTLGVANKIMEAVRDEWNY